jgi:low temperature requirement protein LtrA
MTHESPASERTPWYRRMLPRDAAEEHRAATTLELLFDLCFVVAIAFASDELHHQVAEDHLWDGIGGFAIVFFAIWWAWMNFTWFASAYDSDDVLYRTMTFVQITGALILAAGVPRAFHHTDLGLITAGYVLMRLAMTAQWLRVAHSSPDCRTTALRYAFGVAAVQVLWIARLFLPDDPRVAAIPVLVAAELLVPVWAEAARPTTWHPRHIAERYGLFTIIVLGETILAATTAFQVAFDAGHADAGLILLALGSLAIVFSMWWLYFEPGNPHLSVSGRQAFVWGYGHILIFVAAAAVGAGLQVAIDHETGEAHIASLTASMAVALPVALYLAGVWWLRVLPNMQGPVRWAVPATAAIALLLAVAHAPIVLTALLLSALVALMLLGEREAAFAD